jgi:hypothetical protein
MAAISAGDIKPTTIATVVNKKRITARGYAYVIEIRDTLPSSLGGLQTGDIRPYRSGGFASAEPWNSESTERLK